MSNGSTAESKVFQPPSADLTEGAKTLYYLSLPFNAWSNYSNRPWFSVAQAEAMLWDQQVWFGLCLGHAPLIAAKVEVVSKSKELQAWAQAAWDEFWERFAADVVSTNYFGYAGFEVCYCTAPDTGLLEIDRLRSFHPRDVTPLVQAGAGGAAGKIAGISVKGTRTRITPEQPPTPTRLFGMKGLWLNYRPLYSSNFGRAITEKAYPPWWDKAMPGGAYDLRRLRGVKDAWIGDVLWYPADKMIQLPNGESISAADAVREIGENRASGGVIRLPSIRYADGSKMFEYQAPTAIADSGVIREWLEASDWDIFDGLLVPREVVEAASAGSGFSGRSVPMIMFLGLRDVEFRGYVRPCAEQLFKPLGIRNFGRFGDQFELRPVPLVEALTDAVGGGPAGGPLGGNTGPPGGGAPSRFGPARGAGPPGGMGQFSAEFEEGKHPRGQQTNAGQFAEKPGGGGAAVAERPGAGPAKVKKTRERKAESLGDVVAALSEEHGLDPRILKSAIDFAHEEIFATRIAREEAKLALRASMNLRATDIQALENAGYDHASAVNHPQVGHKFKRFDVFAQQAAREFPELQLGNPDDPNVDFSAAAWDALREGSTLRRFGKQGWEARKTDPEVLKSAVQLAKMSARYEAQNSYEEIPFSAEDLPMRDTLARFRQFSAENPPGESSKAKLAGSAAGLASRAFDPITRRLEALLKKN